VDPASEGNAEDVAIRALKDLFKVPAHPQEALAWAVRAEGGQVIRRLRHFPHHSIRTPAAVAGQVGDRSFVPGRAALRTFLLTSLALGFLGFFLCRAIDAFGPGSWINDVDFNSDSAIPVLMSNDARPLSIFNFYYYGADRWGGWPFLITRFIGRVTGRHWTDHGVFTVQAFWIFLGALVCAGLTSDDYLIVLLAYVIALCLHSQAHYLLFELSQVYAWQTTAVLLAWYGLRRLFDRGGEPGYPRRRYLLILSATICFSYLAIWSSVASIVLLLFLVAVECLRACVRRSETVLRPGVLGGTAVLAAAGLEFLQKTIIADTSGQSTAMTGRSS
jgi:hypothetical protein